MYKSLTKPRMTPDSNGNLLIFCVLAASVRCFFRRFSTARSICWNIKLTAKIRNVISTKNCKTIEQGHWDKIIFKNIILESLFCYKICVSNWQYCNCKSCAYWSYKLAFKSDLLSVVTTPLTSSHVIDDVPARDWPVSFSGLEQGTDTWPRSVELCRQIRGRAIYPTP